jgi:hypothetical protein
MPSWRTLSVGLAVYGLTLVPVSLGQTSVAGVVTLANRALLAGSTATSGATVFSGDLVTTEDEGQIQIQAGRTKLTLQPQSSFRVFRAEQRVVVELERGTLTYATAAPRELTIYALDTRIVPAAPNGGTGQVSVVSRCEMKATSHTNTLDVTSGKETKTIEEGKTYAVRSDFGVDYHDSWKPVPADYPEFDPNSAYHRTHSHSACGLAAKQGEGPRPGLKPSHFGLGAAAVVIGVTCLVICPDFESPDKPKK